MLEDLVAVLAEHGRTRLDLAKPSLWLADPSGARAFNDRYAAYFLLDKYDAECESTANDNLRFELPYQDQYAAAGKATRKEPST